MIYFIYFHSFGINNLYLLSLLDKVPNSIAYCGNDNFPHKRKKVFGYKLSNVTSNLPRTLRYIIRYFEGLVLHIFFCFKALFIKKGTVYFTIMYFLWFELWTVFFLKKIGFKVILVVHDFDEEMLAEYKERTSSRLSVLKILNLYKTNLCVAHNIKLVEKLQSNGVKCEYFPFPPMSVSLLDVEKETVNREIDFLMIGTYRKDKNFEIALDLLKDLKKSIQIVSYGLPLELVNRYPNVNFKSEYVSDQSMVNYLKRSKFVLLPYQGGNASGFPIMAASCGAIPIMGSSNAFNEYKKCIDSNYFFEGEKWIHEPYDVGIANLFLESYNNHFDNCLKK